MTTIPGNHSAINRTQTLSKDSPINSGKPVALDKEVVKKLSEQLQASNPELITQLTVAIVRINQQNISEKEKKVLIAKEYTQAIKIFSASLTEIMQQNDITTSYKNKSAVLYACSANIKNDNSGTDNKILSDVINKTNINLIGFNGMLEIYKQQIFGFTDDLPKLEDPFSSK